MGYTLEAVIGGEPLKANAAGLLEVRLATLDQGLMIMPITDGLFDSMTDGSGASLGFWKLPGGFEHVLARWSEQGPLAPSTTNPPRALPSPRRYVGSGFIVASSKTSSRPQDYIDTATPQTGPRPLRAESLVRAHVVHGDRVR